MTHQNNIKACIQYTHKKWFKSDVLLYAFHGMMPCYKTVVLYLAGFGEGLCDLAVASAVAGGDEIGHAAALQEGCRGDGSRGAEDTREGNHLHQAQADHRRLGVVTKTQTVTEARAHSHNILKRGKMLSEKRILICAGYLSQRSLQVLESPIQLTDTASFL